MVDLLDWQRKGFTGNRWEFDSQEAVGIFKSSVIDILENDGSVRKVMAQHLGLADVDDIDEVFIDRLVPRLNTFVTVVN